MMMNEVLAELRVRSEQYKKISGLFRDFVDRMTEDSDLNVAIARSGLIAKREGDVLALHYIGRKFLMKASFHADMKRDGLICLAETDEKGALTGIIANYFYDEEGNIYDSLDSPSIDKIIDYSFIEKILKVIYKKVGEVPDGVA